MPIAEDVNHTKWTNKIIVYDDGEYSVIWGNYEDDEKPCLGVCWNRYDGGKELGFPNQFGNPIWHVEPRYLTKMILLGLYNESLRKNDKKYLDNLNSVLLICEEEGVS